jgi:POT family proton-dependent oligopeptide transporter
LRAGSEIAVEFDVMPVHTNCILFKELHVGLGGQMGSPTAEHDAGDFFGHPKGLAFLFATEMWERFAYYGTHFLLILYMEEYLLKPEHSQAVLGYSAIKSILEFLFGLLNVQQVSSHIFGLFTGLAYLTPIIGGYLADRVLGQRLTIIIGAVLLAIGHFMMALESIFLLALLVLILGSGAFRPNIMSQVGQLYADGDPRSKRGYSIFYVGTNIGAFFAPLVCGTLAVSVAWRYGFLTAGVAMLIGLIIYLFASHTLPPDQSGRDQQPLDQKRAIPRDEWRAVVALLIIGMLQTLFWAVYAQMDNTTVTWINHFTDRSIILLHWNGEILTPWFQSLNPLMIIVFTPPIITLWRWQMERRAEPSTLTKMAFGCLGLAFANLIMIFPALIAEYSGKASWLWLLPYFAFVTVGELYLSPIGLSLVSRVAPHRIQSMTMGLWLGTSFAGGILGGWFGSFWSIMSKPNFFLTMTVIATLTGIAIWALNAPLKPILKE